MSLGLILVIILVIFLARWLQWPLRRLRLRLTVTVVSVSSAPS